VRLLKDLLTLLGTACIGLVAGGYVVGSVPLYRVNNILTIARCNFVLGAGLTLLAVAYGFRRRAVVAWWASYFAYVILAGYFFWRAATRFEMSSYLTLLVMIGAAPFAALWRWDYPSKPSKITQC
jgi:hypothetical protein